MRSANTSSGASAIPRSTGSSCRDGQYERLEPGADGILRSEVFPGLWLDPAALIGGDSARVLAVAQQGIGSAEHAEFVAHSARQHLMCPMGRRDEPWCAAAFPSAGNPLSWGESKDRSHRPPGGHREFSPAWPPYHAPSYCFGRPRPQR